MPEIPLKTVTLAHPISAADAQKVGATNVKEYQQGEEITVPMIGATRLANARMLADVDPKNPESMRAFLAVPTTTTPAPAPPTKKQQL